MRRRKWFFSTLLFLISVGFLIFSKAFFSRTVVSDSVVSLPATPSNVILLANNDYYPYLKTHFQQAHKKILGTIYLFKAASMRNNEPADLMRELIAARKRNVTVEVVIDLSSDDGESRAANLNAGQLLGQSGVTVRFDREDVATHAKTFVIDDRYCFVGSHNFTHAGMARNEEVSVFIDSPDIARKLSDFIHQIPLSN